MSNPQKAQEAPKINRQKQEMKEDLIKDTKSNSIFSLIRKTCIKLMCVKLSKLMTSEVNKPLAHCF